MCFNVTVKYLALATSNINKNARFFEELSGKVLLSLFQAIIGPRKHITFDFHSDLTWKRKLFFNKQ